MTWESFSEYTLLELTGVPESGSGDRPPCLQVQKPGLANESSWVRSSALTDTHHTLKHCACFKFSGPLWQPKNLGSGDILSRT